MATIETYQAAVFQNAADIAPTSDVISFLIEAFGDKGLVPNTVQQLSLTQPGIVQRLQLSSPNGEWQISFGSGRVDIFKNPTDESGTNVGNLDGFCSDVIDFHGRIQSRFKKRAKRLALVFTKYLREMPDQECEQIYAKLFNPTPFYQENTPCEWNWRSMARLDLEFEEDVVETLNVITAIERVQEQALIDGISQTGDMIRIRWDINTIAQNIEYRFELHNIESFYTKIPSVLSPITEQTMAFLLGESDAQRQ